MVSATDSAGSRARTATGSSIITLGDPRLRPRDDQVAQRQHADQPPVVVDHVDVVDRLGVGLELAQPVDRLGRGQRRGHGDELGRHRPPAESSGNASRSRTSSASSCSIRARISSRLPVGQVGHEVGRVVRAHLLEDVGRPRGLEVLEHLHLRVGLHLLDASASASSSSAASTPRRSRGVSWSMMSARSAGWSSARRAWGTRRRTLAIVLSSGSTSSQSM